MEIITDSKEDFDSVKGECNDETSSEKLQEISPAATSNNLKDPKYRKHTASELHILKKQAVEYYEKNQVAKKMENILNEMFYDKPDDECGHISNYFETYANPVIIKSIEILNTFNSRGRPTLTCCIYGILKNKRVRLVQHTLNYFSKLPDYATNEDRNRDNEDRLENLNALKEFIKRELEPNLINCEIHQKAALDELLSSIVDPLQDQLDKSLLEALERQEKEKLEEESKVPVTPKDRRKSPKVKGNKSVVVVTPDEPADQLVSGYETVGFLSQAFSKASALLKGQELYEFFGEMAQVNNYRLPIPIFSILYSGRAALGKQKYVKEFLILSAPDTSMTKAISNAVQIYNTVADNLSKSGGVVSQTAPGKRAKTVIPGKTSKKETSGINDGLNINSRLVTENGSLCPQLDRIEQGLDLIQDAMKQLNLEPGKDVFMALNLSGQEIFDHEKGKYEILSGLLKTGDEIGDILNDLLAKYPSIIAVFDPLRKVEKDSWQKLAEKLSPKAYVIRTPNARKFYEQIPRDDLPVSGAVLKLENESLTKLSKMIEHASGNNVDIVLSVGDGDNGDCLICDYAVGNNCKFLQIGAPCRGERIEKINRLLIIENLLGENQLLWPEKFQFPILTVEAPPPPPSAPTKEEVPE